MSTVSGLAGVPCHAPVRQARCSGLACLQSKQAGAVPLVSNGTARRDFLLSRHSRRMSSSFRSPVSVPGQSRSCPRVTVTLAYGPRNLGTRSAASPNVSRRAQKKLTMAEARLLSKGELQMELKQRNLSTEGLKEELKKRLFAALAANEAINEPGGESPESPTPPSTSQVRPQRKLLGRAAGSTASRSNGSTDPNTPAQKDLQAAVTQDLHGRLPDQATQSSAHVSGIANAAASSSRHTDFLKSASASPQTAARQNDGNETSDQADSTESDPSDMCVTWLGTASGAPSFRRNVSCIALRFGPATFLVDCGEGTSRQILRAGIDPTSIQGAFISHLHGDHCFGLPGIIELVSEAHKTANTPFPDRALRVYGPPGIQQQVQTALSAGNTDLNIKLLVTEFTLHQTEASKATREGTGLDLLWLARQAPDASSFQRAPPDSRRFLQQGRTKRDHVPVIPGLVWSLQCGQCAGLTVQAAQLQHRLPCWGYVFTEGAAQRPSQGSSQGPVGRKVALLGDTCSSHAIADLAMGADLISHEATFAAGMEKKAQTAQHSTAPMAGAFARRVRAGALVLTHFSNRYSKRGDTRAESNRAESDGDSKEVLRWLTDQAKDAFGSDRVWAAEDFYTFRVKHTHLSDKRNKVHEQTVGALR